MKDGFQALDQSPEFVEDRKATARIVAALSPAGKLAVLGATRRRLPPLTPDVPTAWRQIMRVLVSAAAPHGQPKYFPSGLKAYTPDGFDYEAFRQRDGATALTRLYKPRLERDHYNRGLVSDTPAVEIFYGGVYSRCAVTLEEPAIVPVSALVDGSDLDVVRPTGPRERLQPAPDGFSFVALPKGKTLFRSPAPIAFGRPMPLKADAGGKPPLVMSIFVDGLSGSVFDQVPLSELMPNTHAYFRRHACSTVAHGVAEWTLPNIASVMTGLRPHQHKVLHPTARADVFADGRPYWPAAIRAAGYNTAQFCSNWRKSPAYGYSQGFDRTVYHRGGLAAETVIGEVAEHLEVFKHCPNYVWLTFFDLHHDLGSGPSFLAASAGQLDDVKPKFKSVRMEVSEGLVEQYILKIRRLDLMLGALYALIERRYRDEDVRIGLFSDHGVSFLSQEEINDFLRLTDTRCRVPMMFRGAPYEGLELPKFAQNLDHFRTLFTGVEPVVSRMAAFAGQSADIDLTSAGRTHAITESMYPGQRYLFRYVDDGGSYLFAGPKLQRGAVPNPRSGESRTFRRQEGRWADGEMPAEARHALDLREPDRLAL